MYNVSKWANKHKHWGKFGEKTTTKKHDTDELCPLPIYIELSNKNLARAKIKSSVGEAVHPTFINPNVPRMFRLQSSFSGCHGSVFNSSGMLTVMYICYSIGYACILFGLGGSLFAPIALPVTFVKIFRCHSLVLGLL